jgi:hypothetical protein
VIRVTYKTKADWDELGRNIAIPLRQILAELAERIRLRIISGRGAFRPYPPKVMPQPSVDKQGRAWVAPGWEQPDGDNYRVGPQTAAPVMAEEHETSAAARRDWSGWAVYPSLGEYHALLRAQRAKRKAANAASLGAAAAVPTARWVREGHLMGRAYQIQIITPQRGRIHFAGSHPARGLTAPKLATILARRVGQNLLAVTPEESADVVEQIGAAFRTHLEHVGLQVSTQMQERAQLRSLTRRVAKLVS